MIHIARIPTLKWRWVCNAQLDTEREFFDSRFQPIMFKTKHEKANYYYSPMAQSASTQEDHGRAALAVALVCRREGGCP